MDEENQSYACFTPSFESNWNENGKNALVEKPPGRPGINNSVVSNSDIYQKIKDQMFYFKYVYTACKTFKISTKYTMYTYKGAQKHRYAIQIRTDI